MKKILLITLSLFLMTHSVAYAQGEGGAGGAGGGGGADIFQESMRDFAIVGAVGAFGAVLGLSTLSFVDEPSEHLKNIVVGGAIGIIVGVGVVAWKQANQSKDLYQEGAYLHDLPAQSPRMTTVQRLQWHRKNHYQINGNLGKDNSPSLSGFNVQFSF